MTPGPFDFQDWKAYNTRANQDARRARKFARQGGICFWFLDAQRNGYKPRCPDALGRMTLERRPNGTAPADYATFEHLQRRRDGGAGKPSNVVLACHKCNSSRDAGKQISPPSLKNLAARRMSDAELLAAAKAGTLSTAARGELFSRGIVPNWRMWSDLMARVPLGPH